jgi:hypothetical protein
MVGSRTIVSYRIAAVGVASARQRGPEPEGSASGPGLPSPFKAPRGATILAATEDAGMDDKTRTELEAAVYRRLVEHLRSRTDVQNIDMMNLAGFCRNCLSNWMKEAADAKGVPMTKDQSREIVYGEPFEQWKAKHQKEASAEQTAAFAKSSAASKH